MCRCTLDEYSRSTIGVASSMMSGIVAVGGIVFILVGFYIKYLIEDKILLFGTYNGGLLTTTIAIAGSIVVFMNLIAAKAAFDCSYPETRNRFKKLLMLLLVLLSLVCVLLFICAVLCYTHKYVLNKALKKGMSAAMRKYGKKRKVKMAIDDLQIEFQCCGSENYNDWFQVGWISSKYLNLKHKDVKRKTVKGVYVTDDAPFSCCDVTSIRPCIHHQVSNKTAHYKYRTPNLYRNGCKNTLKLHFHDTVLMPTGHSFLVLIFLQIVNMTLLRLLQTSIFSAQHLGDREGPGEAFCCEYCPCMDKPPQPDREELELPGGQMPDLSGVADGISGLMNKGQGGKGDSGADGKDKDKKDKSKKDKSSKTDKKSKKSGDAKSKKTGKKKGKKAGGKKAKAGKKAGGKKAGGKPKGKKAGGKKKMGKKK